MARPRTATLHVLPNTHHTSIIRKLEIICIHTGKQYQYDLSWISPRYSEFTHALYWSLDRRRNAIGHSSRERHISAFRKFLEFCESLSHGPQPVFSLSDVTTQTLSSFGQWLKTRHYLEYSTAAKVFTTLTRIFHDLTEYPNHPINIAIPTHFFPAGTRSMDSVDGYSPAEYEAIHHAVAEALREQTTSLETAYIKKWKGKPAPLDDVAPWKTSRKSRHTEAPKPMWLYEMKVWWWENELNCEILSAKVLSSFPAGARFYRGFEDPSNLTNKGLSSHTGTSERIQKFYEEIGAGPHYKPRYLGKSCPIRYYRRWHKHDYLVWYWENVLDAQIMSDGKLRKKDPLFFHAVLHQYTGVQGFYKSVGVGHRISLLELAPYYLMLLMRTALNPSVIQRLTIDCLVRDPIDPDRWSINWVKIRAFTEGRTIPSAMQKDTWPAAIIKRVIDVTARIRTPDAKGLWITDLQIGLGRDSSNLTDKAFQHALRLFARIHKLVSDGKSKMPLKLEARRFRPTIAFNEYVRTEDLFYVKTLLGHKNLSQTSSYVSNMGDPILRMRRGTHQHAMFLDLSGTGSSKDLLQKKLGLTLVQANEILKVGGEHDSELSRCSSPKDSPVFGQRKGVLCSAGGLTCLQCPNLVITKNDIVKFFSFMAYHEHLLREGLLTYEHLQALVSEKKYIWEHHILPLYNKQTIQDAREEAQHAPTPEWAINVKRQALV